MPLPLLSYFTTYCGFFLQASPSGPGETGQPGRLGRGLGGGQQGRGAASAFSAPRAPDSLRTGPSWLWGERAGPCFRLKGLDVARGGGVGEWAPGGSEF